MSADTVHHLHPVRLARAEPADTASGLPDFEGQAVELSRIKLSGVAKLEGPDYPNRIDDMVKMIVEGRVTGVHHVVDKDGTLIRVHTIQVVDAAQLPWSFDTSGMWTREA